MCYSPIYIRNPQKTWHHHVLDLDPSVKVDRVKMEFFDVASGVGGIVAVPCRKCFACLKQRARDWRTRLIDEYVAPTKVGNVSTRYPLFVTLTIRPEDYDRVSADPKAAFRKFFERYRYVFGSSCRHFLVSEYGDAKHHTGRLHFHGIFFLGEAVRRFDSLSDFERASYLRRPRNVPRLSPILDNPDKRLMKTQRHAFSAYLEEQLQSFGFIDVGYNTSARAISYCGKYMTKNYKKDFLILVSPGFGKQWFEDNKQRLLRAGYRRAVHDNSPFGRFLPKYYSQKLFGFLDKVEYYWNEIRPFILSRPSPEEIWRRNPLSRYYASELDYMDYLKTFRNYVCPDEKPERTLFSKTYNYEFDTGLYIQGAESF